MFGHLSSLSIRVFDKELMLYNKRSTRAVASAERKDLISNTLNPYQDARHMNFSRMDFSSVQQTNLLDVLRVARDGGALGVFYWEPTWTTIQGNGCDPANPNSGDQWENQALFD